MAVAFELLRSARSRSRLERLGRAKESTVSCHLPHPLGPLGPPPPPPPPPAVTSVAVRTDRLDSVRRAVGVDERHLHVPRVRSPVVRPERWPASRFAWRTHRRNVSAVHPNFSAIELIAAYCDPWAPACSRTNRTARSCTSGEYRDDRGMTPTSHGMESPAIPGRFKHSARQSLKPSHPSPFDRPRFAPYL